MTGGLCVASSTPRNRPGNPGFLRDSGGSDPVAADYLAWRNGDISADELSKRLHAAEERWDSRKDDRLRLDREYELTRRGLDRDDLRWQVERDDHRRELTRKDEREETAARRHEASRRWELEHEDRLRQRQEERTDAKELQRDQREWAKEQLAVRATLGKQAIDRGLFDSTMYDAGAFINSVGDVPFNQSPSQGAGAGVGGSEMANAELKGEVKGELRRGPGRTAPAAEPTADDGDDADDFDPANQEGSLGH